jgi:hypothetical protein
MYSTRMILVLLLLAVLLFCVSLFLLLIWIPEGEEPVRETVREEQVVDITSTQPLLPNTETDIPVSQLREPEIAPLGSDHGMEFPIMDIE